MADHRIVGHDGQRRIESPSQLQAGQQLVRDERLQKILEGFYDAVGEKTAVLLGEYHKMMVAPLALRVAYLEMPWWRKRMLDLGALKTLLLSYFKSGKADGASRTAAPTGAEPEGDRGAEATASVLP